MTRSVLHIIIFLLTLSAFAQDPTTYLSKNEIEVGEPLTLSYRIEIKKGVTPKFIPEQSVIPSRTKTKSGTLSSGESAEVELLNPFVDTIIEEASKYYWIGSYEITAWDSGTYVLEGPPIIMEDSTYYFPSAFLTSNLVKAQKGQDIYDIKEAFADVDDDPGFGGFVKDNLIWIILLVLLIIGFIIFTILRKRNQAIVPIKETSLKEKTLLAIDALEKARLWEKGKIKEHHVELSFIMRSYLTSRYDINLFEKTTRETQLLLSQKGLNAETVKVITTILASSDMVKFAKSEPLELEILKLSQLSRQIVAETSPIEFDHAE